MIDLNHSRNLAVRPRAGNFHVLFLLPMLMAGLGMMLAGRVTAQTFKTLHSFTATPGPSPYGNSDGANPFAGLILSGHTLYGTAPQGGSLGVGTVFKVNIDGTGFTTLHNFKGGGDGSSPYGQLAIAGNTLYGTTYDGGSSNYGTVFAVHTDGTGFTGLHSFTALSHGTNADGVWPIGGLLSLGKTLYGTTTYGGGSGVGTVFSLSADGASFKTLHSFTFGTGAIPEAALSSSGTVLYGTASSGGSEIREPGIGPGSVFKLNTDGSSFTDLYSFNWTVGSLCYCPLVLSGNSLYGTTAIGGRFGSGIVFAVDADGTGFTTLHSFTALSANTNDDGYNPFGGLILSGNILYGTATDGGPFGSGTVFAVNTDGTGFRVLHAFTGAADGGTPFRGALVLSGTTLYGTTLNGGVSGNGTIFRISLLPQLTGTPSNRNLILTWPTNFTGHTLQSTTNLTSAVWTTLSRHSVVINGQNTVTNPISGTQRFFRLSQ